MLMELEQKKILLANVPDMDDAAVMELGKALADYRLQQAAIARRALAAIDEIDRIER